TGALVLQQWPEAAMVMVLFTIAELIEARSLDRARNAIRGLMQLAPSQATVQQADASWQAMPASDVVPGASVRVGPGERIALDGTIVRGQSSIDQAPITGESLPVDKGVGDAVFAGTISGAGGFDYRVTAAANDSQLARIIHAVEDAQGKKAPTQRFVDKFARIYTPVVVAVALAVAVLPPLLLGGAWWDWVYKALVLLVIACPCALVISTPVTIVSGLAAAARKGILVKGGAFLEQGRTLRWLALDKTGTLTLGKPAQTVYESAPGVSDDLTQSRRRAASLAARSDHPVSRAIAQAAQADDIETMEVSDFRAVPGQGVQGVVDGLALSVGNHRMVHDLGFCTPVLEARLEHLERQGNSVVMLVDPQRVIALFAVADTVKPGSRAAIAAIHALGIRTVMLTGDNPHTAQAIAQAVGITEVRGNQLPEDKLAAVSALAGQGVVGMVGDGINDAPALARADIGFAMGALGTDTAIETADVALMDDDLNKLAAFVRLSQATHRILVQNIVLAVGIKLVFLVLTVVGLGTMWMAVFADVGASLLVVANGLRVMRK
ncbi:MAG: heavy metal translocating P-type ATPase, partial [Burkholderiaceae bacterium]